jgi:hypothetical protein
MPHPVKVASRCVFVVAGRVVRVRARRSGWQIRLAETGGALAVAEIRSTNAVPLPPRGACIVVCGSVVYDPVHSWYAIDPVDWWVAVNATSGASDSGLFPSSHDGGWLRVPALRP